MEIRIQFCETSAFGGTTFKIQSSYQSRKKKQKKNGNLYAKSVFDKIKFIFGKTLKKLIIDT